VVPTRGLISARVVENWMGLMTPMNNAFMRLFVSSMEVGDAYNAAVELILGHEALSKFKYLLTLEEDNMPPPDGLLKLYESIDGYAAVGGFDDNTPSTTGHLFQVVCTTNCASFTWTDKSGNLPDIPVDSVTVNPNIPAQVFAGTDFGLYFTDDITANPPVWQRFSAGLPAVMIWDMQIDRGSTALSVWTRGRGAFVWPLPTP